MHLPPVNCLRAFESAARHQSFTKAAAELNLTAAAISQHVRRLEIWLGAPLFSRSARGVVLTPIGRDFGTTVSYGLTHISLAAVHIKSKSNAQPVSLGCVASVTTRWLIPRLPLFRALHPDIQINVVYALDAQTPEAIGNSGQETSEITGENVESQVSLALSSGGGGN